MACTTWRSSTSASDVVGSRHGLHRRQVHLRPTSIELPTFRRAIGPEQWAWIQGSLGYDRSFPISRDWHVRYGKATYRGVPAVFLRHSRIEHIFTLKGEMGPSEAEKFSPSSERGMARGRSRRRRK